MASTISVEIGGTQEPMGRKILNFYYTCVCNYNKDTITYPVTLNVTNGILGLTGPHTFYLNMVNGPSIDNGPHLIPYSTSLPSGTSPFTITFWDQPDPEIQYLGDIEIQVTPPSAP